MTIGTVFIDQERCKGCELCTIVCPRNVLTIDTHILNSRGYHPAYLDESADTCTGCAVCAVICPEVCIDVLREPSRRQRAVQPSH